ncbi:MAG: hypothetical protein SOU07_06955, partial [Bacilli bacterium]|nr:hypothetical protein [Bacilli bacterium]
MDVKSKLASNMRNQILKQYKLNETKRELKKKDSKITSVIYYNNDGVIIGYNNGKLKSASSLSAAKAGNLTDTTIKKDGAKLSTVQINDMNKTYRQIWQYEGETYGVKPGKIERIENGGGEIINLSDVKGWSPEYQSILESFDMINNKYENPDVSKDLNIKKVNAWNSSTYTLSTFGPFNWNSRLNQNFINATGVSFEIYSNCDNYTNYIGGNNIYNFLHIYNNEKKDRMLKIFQIPKLSNYNETEKPKRMEMGYFCKDKKEFKTLFNNQSFTNGKHVYNNKSNSFYVLYNGRLSTMNEPLTIGHLLTLRKNVIYNKTSGNQTLKHRYFKTIKNYLSNISDKYVLEFNNSYDNDYLGGGV